MLFRSVAAAGFFAASVLAQGTYETITTSLTTIGKDNDKLASSLKAFNGEFILSVPILGDNIQLNTDLNDGTAAISNGTGLTDSEAINLVGPVQTLAGGVRSTVDLLISKYDNFKSNNLVGIVYVTLQTTRSNSQKYSEAIISKVPASLQETARNIAKPIDDAFGEAVAKYSS